jgi:alkylation response protein AidB-like acyl-CoA dehydrogenase
VRGGVRQAYAGNDNGFLRLEHVRVPREHLLMRWAKVAADGTFTRPPHDKLAYGTMIMIRAGIVVDSARVLQRATTIAVRYSCVRRQFAPREGAPEQKARSRRCRLLSAASSALLPSVWLTRAGRRCWTTARSSTGCCRCWRRRTRCTLPGGSR